MTDTEQDTALAKRKVQLRRIVERLRMHGGTVRYAGRDWQVDHRSQRAILFSLLQDPWPEEFVWIDAANNEVPMAADDMRGLARAVCNRVSTRRLFARRLKNTIDSAETLEAVNAIDIASGWPSESEPREADDEP